MTQRNLWSGFVAALHVAGEHLQQHRNEDAIRAYLECISGRPEEAENWLFNFALARSRYRRERRTAVPQVAILCGHADTAHLLEKGHRLDEQVVLAGVRPVEETNPDTSVLDRRLSLLSMSDLRSQIFDAVLQTPCDVVYLVDSHFISVIWAMFSRLVWQAEIRPHNTVESLSLADWRLTIPDIPRSSNGLADLSQPQYGTWQQILERFPIAAAAEHSYDDPTAELFELLGGWRGLCPPANADSIIRVTEATILDFTLHIAGVVVHPDYPGMPVRLQVLVGECVVAHTIAVASDKDDLLPGGTGFHFTLSAPVPESATRARLKLRITGTDRPVDIAIGLTENTEAVPPAVPQSSLTIPTNAKVIGKIEKLNADYIGGWAMCPSAPDAIVELVMLVDGQPCAYSRTNRYREDVCKVHGGLGYCGFAFDIPPNLVVGHSAKIEIRSLNGQSAIKNRADSTLNPPGLLEPAQLEAPRTYDTEAGLVRPRRISAIILNRNGADLLRDMFDSCVSADIHGDVEWIVVDHDSTDNSRAICDEFSIKGANVRFLHRRGNYSFSESNNYGARHATGDVLLFANNDLIFRGAFAERLRDYLSDPAIGLLGIKLLDHVDNPAHSALELVQHLGVFFQKELNKSDWIRPYEARSGQETHGHAKATRAACVTGAFCAIRRVDFDGVGGFDEDYCYGLEDVDLCLKVRAILKKEVVCANDISAVHHRGFSRQQDSHSEIRRRRNNIVFNRRWGNWLRRSIRENVFSDPALLTGSRPVIAFVVVAVGDTTSAGEYFTALEMGRALQELIPCHVRYIAEDEWYDLSGVDILIAMVNKFDLAKVQKASPWLVTVNWMRQWFDRWADHPSTVAYDFLLASSATAAQYITERLDRPVGVLPIAAGKNACTVDRAPDEGLIYDYVFTGSRFGPPREIEFQLAPDSIIGTGKVFGHNWEGTNFETLAVGPMAYSRIHEIYASTKIVLDDGNIATKDWGSCNSRVFDSMAAGCLLITNSAVGVRELFGDLVPTFNSRETLTAELNRWLLNDSARLERATQMQKNVRDEHNYTVRARALLEWMSANNGKSRIAIKCATRYAERAHWGDFHYAESLARALRRLGHVVRVDCRESWNAGISNSDEVVIVLRGLVSYKPRPHQCNIMWLISHPHDVTVAEMEGYDHVYVASRPHSDLLARDFGLPSSFLPQCTDTSRFYLSEDHLGSRPERNLYVANSRGIFRDPVRWAIQYELPMDIYGGGWEPFITDKRYRGKLVPNEVLCEHYGSSRLVICDHWEDMRRLGYVSNRLFDVLAAGGRLVIDRVVGLGDLVPERYLSVYETKEEFVALLRSEAPIDIDLRREAAQWAAAHHSFDVRARDISEKLSTIIH